MREACISHQGSWRGRPSGRADRRPQQNAGQKCRPGAAALLVLLLATAAAAADPAGGPQAGLQGALTDPCLAKADVGVLVHDLRTGEIVFSRNASAPLAPASNMKILTAAVALGRLRPEYTFRTSLRADGPLVDGVLEGDLYAVGSGDPSLVPESFFLLARELRRKGLRKVRGDLVGDDSWFDAPGRPPGWPARNFHRAFSAPISALTAAHSAVLVHVRPTRAGSRTLVTVSPFPSFFEVENKSVTSTRSDSLQVATAVRDGTPVVRVGGRIRATSPEAEVVRSVEYPTLYALAGLREILATQGISVEGRIRRGAAPLNAEEMAVHVSRPLHQLVVDMNKFSSNVMAEMILKTLGAEVVGPPGTTVSGARVVREWLDERGVATEGIRILDGSGLTAENRLTAQALVEALVAVHDDFALAPEFTVSLPVGGVDGTLKKRLDSVEGQVRAKTGYIRGAIALSGYAQGADGAPYAFSILVNDSPCPAWKVPRTVDRVVSAMVNGR
jgi:D-alanyl-D-alanine carboxypeptidase/D-alanyl-D-alanine-endopeptidase (penicillin-binding protein 4)